jgi:pyridoxine 4-dehydrogenase
VRHASTTGNAEARRADATDSGCVAKAAGASDRNECGKIVELHGQPLFNLGVDALDVVNLRIMGNVHAPSEGSIEEQVAALAELQHEGLVRHIGLSNVTAAQVAEAQGIVEIVCVQNHYNLVQREDDALVDELAGKGIAYVPFFPLGGFTPIQSSALSKVAQMIGATPMQVALAWLLHRAPNILLIPGTSSLEHLRENMQAARWSLPDAVRAELDAIGRVNGEQ